MPNESKNPTIKIDMTKQPQPKSRAERLADFERVLGEYKMQNPKKYAEKEARGEFDRERAVIKGEKPKKLKIINSPQEPREEIKGEKAGEKKNKKKLEDMTKEELIKVALDVPDAGNVDKMKKGELIKLIQKNKKSRKE